MSGWTLTALPYWPFTYCKVICILLFPAKLVPVRVYLMTQICNRWLYTHVLFIVWLLMHMYMHVQSSDAHSVASLEVGLHGGYIAVGWHCVVCVCVLQLHSYIQWNPSKAVTLGSRVFSHYRKVSTSWGVMCACAWLYMYLAPVYWLITGYMHSQAGIAMANLGFSGPAWWLRT